MNSESISLVRKEWQERRTSFAVCCGWMLCCVVYALIYELTHRLRDPVATFYQSSMLYTWFAGVFLSMKTALAEQTRGTLGFSLALPVSRRSQAWLKLAGGVLTLVAPVVIAAVVMSPFLLGGIVEQAPTRTAIRMQERPSLSAANAVGLLWTATAIAIVSGAEFLVLLSIFGARRRSEDQLGFMGAVFALVWFMLASVRGMFITLGGWIGALFPVAFIVNYSYASEQGNYTDMDLGSPVWTPLGANVLLLLLLGQLFARRYGSRRVSRQSSSSLRRWRRWPAVWSRVPVPLPNGFAALVWVNLRQSLPVALFGLLFAVLATLVSLLQRDPEQQSFRSLLPGNTWFVAVLWAVVVGVGVFASEMQPGLSRFWRSRPIHVSTWFWCKFFTGLVAVIGALDGITIWVSWGTPIGHTSGMSWSYIACMPILHATFYAVAVLGICVFRRPILEGALAIAGYLVASTLIQSIIGEAFEPIGGVFNELIRDELAGKLSLTAHHYPLVYGTLVAIAVASAWWASRAIRQPERRSRFSARRDLAALN